MNKKQKTTRFLGILTVLLGLNLLILGKTAAQNQTATLDIMWGNLAIAVPSSVSFNRLIAIKDEPTVGNVFLNPFDNMQTIQVIDPSNGGTFHVNLTLKNMSAPPSALIQTDPAQDVGPFTTIGDPVTINVTDAKKYFANDTITVNLENPSNVPMDLTSGNEHMRVLSVDTENNTITVSRGVDDTARYASTTAPIPQGTGFTPQHIVPFSDFEAITLHGNNLGQSVDTSSTQNNPPGLNNVSSAISYYYNPATSTAADYTETDFLQSQFIPNSTDPDPTAINAVSAPITLMERTITTHSSGIYSVGALIRANIPANNPSGNYTGELTFSLDL